MIQIYLRIALLVCCLLGFAQNIVSAQSLQPTPDTPKGWKRTTEGRKATVFTKTGLQRGDSLVVKFYQRKVLETNQSLEQWVNQRFVLGNAPNNGVWVNGPKVIRQTGNMTEGWRDFEVGGKKHTVRGLAVGVDKVHVRFASAISSDTQQVRKYKPETDRLLYRLLVVERDAARKENRGTSIELPPPKVKNLKAGGPIKPGRYVGSSVYLKDQKVSGTFDLVLFDNGEFEFLKGGEKYKKTGQMIYSQATGRLNIGSKLENSVRDHENEYCVYGKEATGKMVIFARDGRWQRKLKWVSSSERSSPADIKRAEAIAKAEAERYKHVVDPGQGIQPDEIEAVMYVWETAYRSGAVQLDQEGFLLMKDGRVLDGLPTAPDTLDVAVSRSREPDRWGWWKKEKENYAFAWPVRPRDYRQPNGKQVIGLPLEKGTKLDGDFGMAQTTANLMSNYSSIRRWGIKLNRNGRFLKYRNGSTQMGGVPGMESLATSVWDDEGAVTSITGLNATALSKRKNNSSGSDRMGTYEFDGFRLTLTFDDGHVEHQATFTDEKQNNIWFEGSNLYERQENARPDKNEKK